MSGSTVTLTLATAVNPGDETKVTYAGTTALTDIDETNQAVDVTANTVAVYAVDDQPVLTSAKVTGANTVTLVFSEELTGGAADSFTVTTNGSANTVSGFALSGSTVTLTLGTAVNQVMRRR